MTEQELTNLLQRLISLPKENEYVEFKENNHKPEEIGKRLSALANGAALLGQNYGYLVFGVEDGSHKVVGTSFKPSEEKIGNEELEFWLLRMLNPRLDVRIYEFLFEGKEVALFHIPSSYMQPTLFQNTAYIWVGSITKFLREFPEKERKLWQKPASLYELEYAKEKVSDAEVVALLDTQAVFDLLLKMPYPSTRNKVIEKLIDEKLIVQSNGYFHITNLGALLFAKDLAQFGLERKAPRVIKYKGKNKLYTEKDQIGRLGYGHSFERLLQYISALLPSNEVIELAIRKEIQMYPLLALRELVGNALIHQDLRENDTHISIEIYDDRIEINNPGLPTVEPQRFIDSYNTRNPLLANAMRRMGFCEEKGSGIDKVIAQCEAFQLPAPDFRSNNINQTTIILYAHQDWEIMNNEDKIRATYQHCCLMYVTNQKMNNQSLRERFKIEAKDGKAISKIIKKTVEMEFIKPENSKNLSRKFVNYTPYWA